MSLDSKPLASIEAADLQELINNKGSCLAWPIQWPPERGRSVQND